MPSVWIKVARTSIGLTDSLARIYRLGDDLDPSLQLLSGEFGNRYYKWDTNTDYCAWTDGIEVKVWTLPEGSEATYPDINPGGSSIHLNDFGEIISIWEDVLSVNSAVDGQLLRTLNVTFPSIVDIGFLMDEITIGDTTYMPTFRLTWPSYHWQLLTRSVSDGSISAGTPVAYTTSITSLVVGPTYVYGIPESTGFVKDLLRANWLDGTFSETIVTLTDLTANIAVYHYDKDLDQVIIVCTNGDRFIYSPDLSTLILSKTDVALSVSADALLSKRLKVGYTQFAVMDQTSGPTFNHIYIFSAIDLELVRIVESEAYPDYLLGFSYRGMNKKWGGVFLPTHSGQTDFWFFIPLGEFDSNPAHIIYESLTNTIWGMGSPSTAIDVDSFEAAAAVLYNEALGLSLMWTRQSTIESFISEILDHIEATLFVNPQNGLLTLKLIRADYSLTGLPEYTPDNSEVTKFSRKLWGETVNEIIVTWTNPENEQEETVIAQDLANIVTQGGIVSDSRNYYGVRNKELAMRLAQRDLRSSSTPLASCDIEVNREAWDLLPGDVVILNSPEDGINALVMRVGPVDYGRIGDAKVRASLVEDVFALATADYSVPPNTGAVDPSEAPTSADDYLIFTLPYYWVVNEIEPVVDPEYPEVYAGVLASEEGSDAFDYELMGEVTDTLGDVTFEEIGTKSIISRALLTDALSAEAESTLIFPAGTQGPGPQIGGFVLIEGTDDTDTELCLILDYSSSSDTHTLSRGVLDTVPRAWPAGTPVWFLTAGMVFFDSLPRSDAEVVNYKQLIRTSLGMLDESAAPTITETLIDRPYLPLRPANVLVNSDSGFGAVLDLTGVDPIPTSWARRNRLTEDSVILAWTDGDVTPEASQTTVVRLLDLAENVLHEYTGIAGTSQNVDPVDFAGEEEGYIEFVSQRDTFESLQGHRVRITLTSVFEFEDGELYEFEDDEPKIFEG